MSSMITASVGAAGGVNRFNDVGTVQRLLNQVPPPSGGPTPPLQPDSQCGPKTIAAIQKFQLRQFGWSGADGRVDPNGQTLRRLNDFDIPLLTTASILMCPHGAPVTAVLAGVSIFSRPSPAPGILALHVNDVFTIAGCPFFIQQPSPCILARWITMSEGLFLNIRSVGTCLSPVQIPQGPVNILKV
jgi:hypothetical protein